MADNNAYEKLEPKSEESVPLENIPNDDHDVTGNHDATDNDAITDNHDVTDNHAVPDNNDVIEKVAKKEQTDQATADITGYHDDITDDIEKVNLSDDEGSNVGNDVQADKKPENTKCVVVLVVVVLVVGLVVAAGLGGYFGSQTGKKGSGLLQYLIKSLLAQIRYILILLSFKMYTFEFCLCLNIDKH